MVKTSAPDASEDIFVANRFDVIVVGAGIIGSATARELGCRGRRVALFEQYELEHTRGSSHGNSRIFRLAYNRAVYVRLAQEAHRYWLDLEVETGSELLRPGGAVDVGKPDELKAIQAALTSAGADSGRRQSSTSVDQFRIPDGFEVLCQPDGGTTWAARARATFLELARAAGVWVIPGVRVDQVSTNGATVSVIAAGNTYSCDRVVLAAAGWTSSLLEGLGLSIPIRVTREHVAYYAHRSAAPFMPFIWHPGDGGPETYGLPNLADEKVKIGRHIAGTLVEPGSEGVVRAEEVELINRFVAKNVPVLDPNALFAETCLYASTPDDDFVMDRVGPVVIGAGFGGHGFKFAPAVGAILADLADDESTAVDPTFALSRFGPAAHA
jgi:sarcosine oxidase